MPSIQSILGNRRTLLTRSDAVLPRHARRLEIHPQQAAGETDQSAARKQRRRRTNGDSSDAPIATSPTARAFVKTLGSTLSRNG